jgi:hypothetical protein
MSKVHKIYFLSIGSNEYISMALRPQCSRGRLMRREGMREGGEADEAPSSPDLPSPPSQVQPGRAAARSSPPSLVRAIVWEATTSPPARSAAHMPKVP